jgi:C4-type Zn-finger protein
MYVPAPTMRPCPNCKSEMTVAMVTPLFFFDGLDEVTYRCTKCSVEMKRTFNNQEDRHVERSERQ